MTEYSDSAYLYEVLAHAEAVASRLVEIVCEQEGRLQQWHQATADAIYSLAQDRDAARAEAARLRSPEWEAEVRADEIAKVLADLRARADECSTVGEVIDIIDGMSS